MFITIPLKTTELSCAQLDTIPDSNKRAWMQIFENINRSTCGNVRAWMQKAKKINRRATLIWEERVITN